MATIAFLHAHPDDEAIFTGGSIAALTDAGHRVVLMIATGGELGLDAPSHDVPSHDVPSHDVPSHDPAAPDPEHRIRIARRSEVEQAATTLGIHSVRHLDYLDSGLAGDSANNADGSFFSSDADEAAEKVAQLITDESVDTIVVYDEHGIYGHPDHVKAHLVGLAAAELTGIRCRYEVTVDREYLHFVETHLVEEAALAGDLGLARSHVGTSSVEIHLTVDVRAQIDRKRQAMAAHRSQLPENAPVFGLHPERFIDVYGWEWYRRLGPPGPLDDLASR